MSDRYAEVYINGILEREGSCYTNDPSDSGGPTKYGITEVTARAYGYTGSMRDLTEDMAREIYLKRYWTGPGFDKVGAIFPKLGESLLDFGVVAGPQRSAKALQMCLNAMNQRGKDYPDVSEDGVIGPMTLHALKSYLDRRRNQEGAKVLYFMVAAQKSVHFVNCARSAEKNEKYEYGWQQQRALLGVREMLNQAL